MGDSTIDMTGDHATERGERFRALDEAGTFLLANVGDAGTARALSDAGVDAIATSSAAHATTIGRADAAAENGYGDEPEDMARAVARSLGLAAVGAGCLYARGTWDLPTIRTVAAEAGGPVNVLVPLGSALRVDDLAEVGVRRISLGDSLYSAQVSHGAFLVDQVLATGTFTAS